jgi:hypothetical protein
MVEWIEIGDNYIRVDSITRVKMVDGGALIFLDNGEKLALRGNIAINLQKHIVGNALKFYDNDIPTRDFSAT